MNFTTLICLRIALLVAVIVQAKLVVAQALVGIQYGKHLIIKQNESNELLIISGHADPILYNSRAYLTVWKVESLEELNDIIREQSDFHYSPSSKILENMGLNVVVDFKKGSNITPFGANILWMPSDQESGTLDLSDLNQPIKLGILDQSVRIPTLKISDLLSLDDYTTWYKSKKSERLRALRAKYGVTDAVELPLDVAIPGEEN